MITTIQPNIVADARGQIALALTLRRHAAFVGPARLRARRAERHQALADGHPYLSEGAGNYAVDIFELMPVPFEV